MLNYQTYTQQRVRFSRRNRRRNDNLEQQAQALFKSWFVDFEPFKDGKFVDSELGMIPEGWHAGKLSDIANITMGQSPNGNSFNEVGNGVLFYQGRTEFGFRYPSIRLYTTEPTRFAELNSTLLSVRAPVGDINLVKDRCCIGRGLASIKAKNEWNSFIYYTLNNARSILEQYNGEGTVFGSINRKDLENLSVIVPSDDFICLFESQASIIDNEIRFLSLEIDTLTELRDSLLPKLMSGELKINDLNC